jgi:glycosyltransferase involved in cell wall biosynthesis
MDRIYDAEAIFTLREVRQDRIEGKVVSEAEVERRVTDELSLCRGFTKVLTVSKEEASYFRKHGFDPHVVGHAAVIEPCPTEWDMRQDILFVGAILNDWHPNAHAVFWFLEHVWPELQLRLPWSRLVIAGLNRSQRLKNLPVAERTVVTGAVDDLTPFYAHARVFVAPNRAAAGIPLKVVEAAGMGVPIVATSLLVSQLGWESPREILKADSGSEFANACVSLCTDEASWRLQRDAALARVTAEYSRAVFAEQLRLALGL